MYARSHNGHVEGCQAGSRLPAGSSPFEEFIPAQVQACQLVTPDARLVVRGVDHPTMVCEFVAREGGMAPQEVKRLTKSRGRHSLLVRSSSTKEGW